MKNYVPKPQNVDAPRPEMVVAVRSLKSLRLLIKQDEGDLKEGQLLPIHGGTFNSKGEIESVYKSGTMPNEWRSGKDENLGREFCLGDLPALIDETTLNDYPGVFMVVLTDYELVELPEPKEEIKGRVIEFPASQPVKEEILRKEFEEKLKEHKRKAKRAKKLKVLKGGKPGPNQIFFIPPTDPNVQPNQLSA